MRFIEHLEKQILRTEVADNQVLSMKVSIIVFRPNFFLQWLRPFNATYYKERDSFKNGFVLMLYFKNLAIWQGHLAKQ